MDANALRAQPDIDRSITAWNRRHLRSTIRVQYLLFVPTLALASVQHFLNHGWISAVISILIVLWHAEIVFYAALFVDPSELARRLGLRPRRYAVPSVLGMILCWPELVITAPGIVMPRGSSSERAFWAMLLLVAVTMNLTPLIFLDRAMKRVTSSSAK